MNKKRGMSGFTMAELLIVVAIIAVLGAVGFVAVQNYQRGMAQLECDTIAKEIFVAAQNHLTMAESQGYLGLDDTSYGTPGTTTDDNEGVYYYTVNGIIPDGTLLSLMLPFGAIDETVRTGGSYIIRYQPKPARILDVFYCSTTDPRFSYTLSEDDYKTLLNIVYNEDGHIKENNKDARREYGDSKAVVGWFGGEGVLLTGDYDIVAPEISVENGERLTVTVTDRNTAEGVSVRLIVSSKNIRDNNEFAKIAFDLTTNRHPRVIRWDGGIYEIVLDSVIKESIGSSMSSFHFAEMSSDMTLTDKQGTFIPGEDIVVQAVAYSNDKLANIAYSAEITVNSLFADLVDVAVDPIDGATTERQAAIACFRHLENLDADISDVSHEALHITQAKQVADLVWNEFVEKMGEDVQILKPDSTTFTGLEKGCYKPVNADYLTLYDGGYTATDESGNPMNASHSITGIPTTFDDSAGLFGKFEPTEATISNLELIDFEITSTGDAGALAGTLTNTTVRNVLAYHNNGSAQTTITATGNAGGLVGSMTGGKIEQCAASLYVQAGANAGGLVGKVESANITASYSGGHTDGTAKYDAAQYNVTASDGIAGGLIGDAKNAAVNSCYSTCSTSGKNAAGGLIGSVDSGKVTVNYCYAAGLVKSDAHAGTFLGQGTLNSDSSHNYFVSGINGTMESGCDAAVLPGVVETGSSELCKPAIDADDLAKDKRNYAVPYDTAIITKKRALEPHPRYTYLTIQQICEVSKPKDAAGTSIVLVSSDFINKHYGDWQEPVALGTGLELINAEKLTANVSLPVSDLGEGQMLTMMVKGKTSGQYAYLVMSLDENGTDDTYDVALKGTSSIEGIVDITGWLDNIIVKAADIGTNMSFEFGINLDSITDAGCHFAQLFPAFIPGEDIAVAIRGNEVTAVEMQAVIASAVADPLKDETNSLFASVSEGTTASIGNFRHLENLDKAISGLGGEESKVTIDTAIQLLDMDWMTDWSGGWKDAAIYLLPDDETPAEPLGDTEHFIPVDLNYPLDYQGNSNAISNLVVNHAGSAGLFGSMSGGSISNLELIDFSVKGTGDAGALAGTLTGTNVTNVLAHNSTNATDVNVTATGDAGGLIGSMSGGTVEKCAAAVIVSGVNAGGLIGTVNNATVKVSYSGGHATKTILDGDKVIGVKYSDDYNVKSTSGITGGLIGIANDTEVENSYSTCSAHGITSGGFVGSATDSSLTNCYATGLVEGEKAGAFAGVFADSSSVSGCKYYEIINEPVADTSNDYMAAVGEGEGDGIGRIDENANTYDTFIGAPSSWKDVGVTYNKALNSIFVYGGEPKYSLPTVAVLAGTEIDGYVSKHYGDWPAPELLVVNN